MKEKEGKEIEKVLSKSMDLSDAKQIYFVRLTEKISKQIMLNILSWMDRDKDIDSTADITEFLILKY